MAICPCCGVEFTPTHGAQVFLKPSHHRQFYDLMRQRGQVAIPFMLAWRGGKRGRTEDTAYALQQLAALADRWRAEDKAAGRRPDLIVSKKRAQGWQAVDLG